MKTAARGMSAREMLSSLHMKNGGDIKPTLIKPTLKTGKGGIVPGNGKGDKIPAKYEPGEFVVSNAMLEAKPGLRKELEALRASVLAQEGKTPQQADARAMLSNIGGIRAQDGFGGGSESDRMKTYQDALQKQKDLEPSWFSTQTPTSKQALADAKAATDAAYQSIYQKDTPVNTASGSTSTPQATNSIAQNAAAATKNSTDTNPNYQNEGRSAQPLPDAVSSATPTPEKSAREILGAMPQNTSQAGVMRYDVAGKSPLYTNMTDESGIKDNERLMSRAAPDTAALDNMQQKQDAADQARARLSQWNREVADAQAINQATNDQIYRSQHGEKAYRDLLRIRNDQQRIGNEAQANQNTAQTARQRLSMETAGMTAQNQQANNMAAAQKALLDAKTPDESSKAADLLRTLMGKDKPAPMPRATVVPGGQVIDPITGQITTAPSAIYDNQTGQFIERPQQKSIASDQQAIAIRDNKNMSREQKIAELKKLGYQ